MSTTTQEKNPWNPWKDSYYSVCKTLAEANEIIRALKADEVLPHERCPFNACYREDWYLRRIKELEAKAEEEKSKRIVLEKELRALQSAQAPALKQMVIDMVQRADFHKYFKWKEEFSTPAKRRIGR